MDIDAVIIEVEFQLESDYEPFGHFVCLRFIDQLPNRNKLKAFGSCPTLCLTINFVLRKHLFFIY